MSNLDIDENPDPDYEEPASVTDGDTINDYQPVVMNDQVEDETDAGDGSMLPTFQGKFMQGEHEIAIDLSQVTYKNDFRARGFFVIFNHQNFSKESKYHSRPRRGSEADVKRLTMLMTDLGFEVKVYDNPTRRETNKILRKYGSCNMANKEMFGMAILTHGEDHGVLFTYDEEMYLNEYIDAIKMNQTLVGKPKLFFVQACRGSEYMEGWRVKSGTTEKVAAPVYRSWPLDADILIHYATTEGHLSWRSPVNGSWFIVTLCNILRWAYHEELHHLLVRVNSVVALNFASATGQERSNNKKQMPQIQTQLTKLVYLKSREDPSVDPRDPG